MTWTYSIAFLFKVIPMRTGGILRYTMQSRIPASVAKMVETEPSYKFTCGLIKPEYFLEISAKFYWSLNGDSACNRLWFIIYNLWAIKYRYLRCIDDAFFHLALTLRSFTNPLYIYDGTLPFSESLWSNLYYIGYIPFKSPKWLINLLQVVIALFMFL